MEPPRFWTSFWPGYCVDVSNLHHHDHLLTHWASFSMWYFLRPVRQNTDEPHILFIWYVMVGFLGPIWTTWNVHSFRKPYFHPTGIYNLPNNLTDNGLHELWTCYWRVHTIAVMCLAYVGTTLGTRFILLFSVYSLCIVVVFNHHTGYIVTRRRRFYWHLS